MMIKLGFHPSPQTITYCPHPCSVNRPEQFECLAFEGYDYIKIPFFLQTTALLSLASLKLYSLLFQNQYLVYVVRKSTDL